jgi:hypothetical protein
MAGMGLLSMVHVPPYLTLLAGTFCPWLRDPPPPLHRQPQPQQARALGRALERALERQRLGRARERRQRPERAAGRLLQCLDRAGGIGGAVSGHRPMRDLWDPLLLLHLPMGSQRTWPSAILPCYWSVSVAGVVVLRAHDVMEVRMPPQHEDDGEKSKEQSAQHSQGHATVAPRPGRRPSYHCRDLDVRAELFAAIHDTASGCGAL